MKIVSLSISKSPPDLATISAGGIIMLPACGGRNSNTSANSIELRPCTGIRTPTIVIAFLAAPSFASNQESSLIFSFSLSNDAFISSVPSSR